MPTFLLLELTVASVLIETVKTIEVPNSCVVQTPLPLANAMIGALGNKTSDTWLEPCVGNGALLGAMSRNGIKKEAITGLDVDASPQPNDRYGNILRGTEFLRWSRVTEQRFDKIVANPPYVALERLDAAIQQAAIDASLSEHIRITGNGNAWYAFLCASIRLLKKDGSLCFLLPAAWDYANYAEPLRKLISSYFSSIDVFRTATPIFRAMNVQEGSIMLLAKGRQDGGASKFAQQNTARHEVASIDDLIEALVPSGRRCQTSSSVASPAVKVSKDRQSLGTLVSIRLGTVTGDSAYFLLNESRRKDLKLPLSSVRPVLSKAKHLNSPRMNSARWTALKDADERVWLFNPGPRITNNRFVQSYLDFGLDGGCKLENHKVSIRKPWFRCPDLPDCDAFMSGMSAAMPTLSFCAMPALTVTNTLYAVMFLDPSIRWQDRLGLAMSLLQSDVREQMRNNGRPYAAGLLKHEPCDLLRIQVPKIGSVKANWSAYRLAIQALKNGEELECSRIADSCFV